MKYFKSIKCERIAFSPWTTHLDSIPPICPGSRAHPNFGTTEIKQKSSNLVERPIYGQSPRTPTKHTHTGEQHNQTNELVHKQTTTTTNKQSINGNI